jgi:hypothetical protein
MTYGKILGNQGVRGRIGHSRTPDWKNRYNYPERWLNEWQLREKKTAAQIAEIIGEPVEEVERALRAKNAPQKWKTAIGKWHRMKRRLHDLYRARERAQERAKS